MVQSFQPLLSLEMRLLRYVIAVAEELHFTRASQRLHLATPSLSRQIKQLEQALGYPLFERRTREVVLTAAGAAFVAEARRALMYAQRAVEAGAAANASNVGVYRIGYTPLLDATLLPQIRDFFARALGETSLFFQSTYSLMQMEQILSGRLDVGLVVLPIASNELRVDMVFRSRLVVAIPAGWAVAETAVLGPDEIAEQPIVWFGKPLNPQLYQHLLEWCRQAGFTPRIVHEVSSEMEVLETVAAGVGISFVKETVPSRFHPEGIVFREFAAPELTLEIGVAYRDEGCSESLLAFLQVLKELSNRRHKDGLSTADTVPGC